MDVFSRLVVSSVTFRDLSLEECAQRAQGLGFTQLDITAIPHYCDHFDPLLVDVGEAECHRVRAVLDAHSLHGAGVTGYPANLLDRDINRDDWLDRIFGFVQLGIILGAGTLTLPGGWPAPADDTWRGEVEHARAWLGDVASRAATARLTPAVRVQAGTLLNSSSHALELLQLMKIATLGLAVDSAQLALMGEDPVRAVRALGHVLRQVTLSDTDGTRVVPPGEGHLDFSAILDALLEAGYTGPLVLAVDDITLTPDARADALLRGWRHLDRIALPKAA